MQLLKVVSYLLLLLASANALPQGTSLATPAGTQTDAELAALCASAPKNRWNKHVCEAYKKVQPGCMPQRRFAYNKKSASNVKGVIILFHGYTAW
jgi:hypothetical protein